MIFVREVEVKSFHTSICGNNADIIGQLSRIFRTSLFNIEQSNLDNLGNRKRSNTLNDKVKAICFPLFIHLVTPLNLHRLKLTDQHFLFSSVVVQRICRDLLCILQPALEEFLLSGSICINCVGIRTLAHRAPANMLLTNSNRGTSGKLNLLSCLIGLLGL